MIFGIFNCHGLEIYGSDKKDSNRYTILYFDHALVGMETVYTTTSLFSWNNIMEILYLYLRGYNSQVVDQYTKNAYGIRCATN